jgi:ribosomal protein L40E
MSVVVQVCARCAARWPVVGGPAQWCPRCHGVLLAPIRTDHHQPPATRGFRWIARSPLRRSGLAAEPPTPSPTPHYTEIPRWGLHDPVVTPSTRRNWPELLADKAAFLLTVTAGLYAFAVLAELGRYGVLMRNRTRLIDPTLLALSDIAVFVGQAGGMLFALLSGAGGVCWLLRMRRRTFARAKKSDPRTSTEVVVGCAVPGLNLVMPGVFLLEVIRRDPRAVLLVRAWWSLWVFGAVLVVFNWFWRSRPGLQAMADGVLLSAFTALVAATTAVLALMVLRRLEGRTLKGTKEPVTRWVVATGPPPQKETDPHAEKKSEVTDREALAS